MGSILPITGALGQYGPGMQAAVDLAVEHVNDAGGPLGREIAMHDRDSETDQAKAVQKYNSLVEEEGIVGFVGAASSGVSTAIARNVADDEVMQVSNSSTSPALAGAGWKGDTKYFGRTAPNDGQQGIVMGYIMSRYLDAGTAAFLHIPYLYGKGLAEAASGAFDGETLRLVAYDQRATDYTSTLDELHEGDPDAIGFIGYPNNGRTILQQWAAGGYGTSAADWVLGEGLNSRRFFEDLDYIVAGMHVASPDPEETAGAATYEREIGAADTLFAAHAYDALFLQALAIQRAGEASGTAIARNLRAVANPPGETVTVDEFGRARDVLADGGEVNYQGASTPIHLNENLDTLQRHAVLQIRPDGSTRTREHLPASFFEGQL